jgi:hypothetical protein
MIRLTSKNLTDATSQHLANVQQNILEEADFAERAKKAIAKWDSKTSGTGKDAFGEVKRILIEMCVGIETCVYCEDNEATDIEHIFPKKIFPEKAFLWGNYVLACKICNTTYKSDNFEVFNPQNSATRFDVKPPRRQYLQPPNDDALFINQLIEDPMDFIELDLVNQEFIFTEIFPEGSREYLKANYTIELLGLNRRRRLVRARRNATRFFRDRLGRYVEAKKAENFVTLEQIIDDDFGGINQNNSFETEKERIKAALKEDILTYPHITVWKELLRQRARLPKINQLLNDAPEAVTW